jgi:hypothetical protein
MRNINNTPKTMKITELVTQEKPLIKKDDISKKYLTQSIKTDNQYIPVYVNMNNEIIEGQDIVDILVSLKIEEVKVIQIDCADSLSQRRFYLNKILSETKLTALNYGILTVEDKTVYELENPSAIKKEISKNNLKKDKKSKTNNTSCYTNFSSEKLGVSKRTVQNRAEIGTEFNKLDNNYKEFVSDFDSKLSFTRNELLKLFKIESIYYIDLIKDVEDIIQNNKEEMTKRDFMNLFNAYYNPNPIKTDNKPSNDTELETSEEEPLVSVSIEEIEEDELESEEFDPTMIKNILRYDIDKYFKVNESVNNDFEQDKVDFKLDFGDEIKYIEEIIRERISSEREAA